MIKLNNKIVDNVVDIGETFEEKAPRTKEHFALYLAIVLNARIPNGIGCKDHQSPLDAMWAAYAEIDDFSIWYAMRGSGKTFDVSLLGFMESVFKPKCWTTVLGGSLEQSTKAVAYVDNFWNMPKINLLKNKLLVNRTVAGRGFKTRHGSQFTALAASTKSVRGPHPQKLRLDELDEMDETIYNASMGQPKENFGIKDNIVISSTLHNAFGLMSKIIDEKAILGAILYKWCVEEVQEPFGFWTKEEIQRRKRQLIKAMWESEYLLKRPKLGDTVFDWKSVDDSFIRGMIIEYDKRYRAEACIDWGYTCTVMHIVQDFREFVNIPESYSWEYFELTERCKEIVDICIERKVYIIYCDSNPKDSYITLRKIVKQKRAAIKVIPIAFSVWKDISINVLRFYLEKNIVNIKDKIFQDKLKKYHYSDVDTEKIAKEDDHYPDAWIAWGASRWNILGYLKDEEIKKRQKQEKKLLDEAV